jgi:hypothetical protein
MLNIKNHKSVNWCGSGGLEEALVKIFSQDLVDDYWRDRCDYDPPYNGTYTQFYVDEQSSEIEKKIKELMGEADLICYSW